jgi:hypothetical protein
MVPKESIGRPGAAGEEKAMTEQTVWVIAAAAAIFVVPPVVYSINEHRLRRRHRALAGRRKVKMRL